MIATARQVALFVAALGVASAAVSRPREPAALEPSSARDTAGPSARPPAGDAVVAADSAELEKLLADPAGPRHIALLDRVYHGDFVVRRPLTLSGSGRTVIEGSGHGTVVSIESDDAALENVAVRRSGRRQTTEDAGIRAKGARIRISAVSVEDSLFGITLGPCPHCLVERARVTGLQGADAELRGDGIKLWESSDSVVRGSVVDGARDVVVWYSRRVKFEGNTVRNSRYGIHFMYAHDSIASGSRIENDVVGIFVMYSSRLHVEHNVLVGARGPAGMGIGFKESDGVLLENNWIVGNTTGVYLDRTPRSAAEPVSFQRNMIALNDVALGFLGSEAGLTFANNDFHENVALCEFENEGQPLQARFEHNHWSEYAGYDLNHDGIGDVAFELKQLSRELSDATPSLRLFQGTAAFAAIDAIAHVAPVLASRTLLVDTAPAVQSPLPRRAHD